MEIVEIVTKIMNYLMGHPEIDPKDYGYNFDDPKVQEETYTEEEKIEENDQEIKIENLKKLSDNNSSNRTYFYAKYHDRRRITGQFFSFIDFLRNLNRNEGVNVLIAIEETKVLILEDVYEEYKKLFPKNSWYDSNIFASYCIRSSKKDYFFGMDPFITKLDIEDFIDYKIYSESEYEGEKIM